MTRWLSGKYKRSTFYLFEWRGCQRKAAVRRCAPLTRGPPHFPGLAGADSADDGELSVRFSAEPAYPCPTPPATVAAASAAAHLTTACGHQCIYLSQSHHVHPSARGAVVTWVRREFFVPQICRKPFVEGDVLQSGKKKHLHVCLWLNNVNMQNAAGFTSFKKRDWFIFCLCFFLSKYSSCKGQLPKPGCTMMHSSPGLKPSIWPVGSRPPSATVLPARVQITAGASQWVDFPSYLECGHHRLPGILKQCLV